MSNSIRVKIILAENCCAGHSRRTGRTASKACSKSAIRNMLDAIVKASEERVNDTPSRRRDEPLALVVAESTTRAGGPLPMALRPCLGQAIEAASNTQLGVSRDKSADDINGLRGSRQPLGRQIFFVVRGGRSAGAVQWMQ